MASFYEEAKVVFDEEEKARLLKEIKGLYMLVGSVYKWVDQDILTERMSKVFPASIENHFSDIVKVLNYESHLLEEKEGRHVEVRKLNIRIRELEGMLGSERAVDGLAEQLQHLSNVVKDWWSVEGFNHLSEYEFYPYGGFRATYCFMLERPRRVTLAEDLKDRKDHVQDLVNMGFEFQKEVDFDCQRLKLIDNPLNRSLLLKMMRERFPSVEIFSWNNQQGDLDNDEFVIWKFDAIIRDLSDI